MPRKVFQEILGQAVLSCVIDGVLLSERVKQVIVAVPDDLLHLELVNWLSINHPRVDVFRGPEHDVLGRFVNALDAFNVPGDASVVRVTSDCPLINPIEIDQIIYQFDVTGCDYLANTCPKPGSAIDGFDVEVFSAAALRRLGGNKDLTANEKEHVTVGFLKRLHHFDCKPFDVAPLPLNYPSFSLDTEQDLHLIRKFVVYAGGLDKLRRLEMKEIKEHVDGFLNS